MIYESDIKSFRHKTIQCELPEPFPKSRLLKTLSIIRIVASSKNPLWLASAKCLKISACATDIPLENFILDDL